MDFKKINNYSGWGIFALATLVYLISAEETASYWDCGEFIAVSYKLMVPHPPGAPFFLLLGRIFSFFALGDVTEVAYWINMISVLSSGFTILFLFWTISMLARKTLKVNPDTMSVSNTFGIIGASAVGALAYTFSDSFWFSASEAEVYALSSFFTAFVVWAILKWDLMEDESRANRWIILIAYMMGLSIGVHLLNLVTIPALGLIYYFKKYKEPGPWGIAATLAVSGFLVILINNIIIPGLPTLAGKFEIYFVNSLGLPFGSGAIFIGAIIIGALIWGIFYSIKKQSELLNTALISLAFVLIGYSSYTLVVIRSQYDSPIDQNDPEDVMSFVKYLKREQYGSRPLFHGQYFTAQPTGTQEGEVSYVKGEDKYEQGDKRLSYTYDKSETTIFPRMYSSAPQHVQRYREITGLRNGEKPTFNDNITFLFKHQLGTMYMRYFMWNFVGRESDIQDAGWLGPIESFEKVPEALANNAGRNSFLAIPLILGIIGMFFQLWKDKRNFVVVAMLFFLTGIALILYLNSPPIEPRERDYIYVGSYYAFAIWIGFAVLAFAEMISSVFNKKMAAVLSSTLCLIAPAVMAQQGWDDHNRSNRFFSVDSAKNFLASCAPNAILYTGGDNDTFPLWYSQDVEGFRTDMRVVVLSYYNTDWYIGQMMRPVYESPEFPFTLTLDNYKQGGPNDYLPYEKSFDINAVDANQFLALLKSDDKRLRIYPSANAVPSRTFTINVNKSKVRELGIVPKGLDSMIVDRMVLTLKPGKNALEKKDLAILDNLASNDWSRPIYVNNTSMQQINFDLSKYAIQEGNAFRILPVANPDPSRDFVNVDVMYDNLINKFHYRELDNPNVYYNQDYRNFVQNHRTSFNTLAQALLEKGDKERSRKAIFFSLEKIPDSSVPFDFTSITTIDLLYKLGEIEKAKEIAQLVGDRAIEMADYLARKDGVVTLELQRNLVILSQFQRILITNGEDELAKKYADAYRSSEQYLNRRNF